MANSTGQHVTLARLGDQIWVAGGEDHLDMLLIGQLPPGVTVELVECADRAALFALWQERSSEPTEGAQPWALNPAVCTGLLGRLGLAPGVVQFTPWSAMLDDAAQEVVASAAAWLLAHPGGSLTLRQSGAGAVPGLADLQRLRAQLVAAALARAGVDPALIHEDMAGAADKSAGKAAAKSAGKAGAAAERLHIVMTPPG